MRIGINAHLLSFEPTYRQAGVSRYIEALIRHLPDVVPDDELVLFTGPARPPDGTGFDRRLIWRHSRIPTANPAVRIAWEQVAGPIAARRARVDLLHSPVNVVSLAARVPQIVTVHDLAFHHFPEQYPGMKQRYLKRLTRLSVRRAARVIAVSESTRQDILSIYGGDAGRIVTVPNGVGDEMRPLPPDEVTTFRRERDLPESFLFFLGTLQPRKNLETLLRAYAAVADQTDWPLIVAGAAGWQHEGIGGLVTQLGLGDRVRFVGHVPGEALPLWYNAASVLVYPSLYEGFGLPVLEAMACGTAVVASNASAIPEVVGDAGLLVDPTDPDAIARAILRLVRDAEFRQQLGRFGRERATGFSWRATVERTVEVYRQVWCGSR